MSLPPRDPAARLKATGPLIDSYGRAHDYLRISVTDRCNYRCTYCLPAEGINWLPRESLLRYEEIVRIVRIMSGMGLRRVRLTGGEPTVRRGLSQLVAMLNGLGTLDEIAMTTNGHRFAKQAAELAEAGLSRVNISLDSLDAEQFRQLTRGGNLQRVLAAIDSAIAVGLEPVKINAVVVKGVNEDQVDRMIDYFSPMAGKVEVRFIEWMPFDGNGARRFHIPASQLRERIAAKYGLLPSKAKIGGGPAVGWRLGESGLKIGFISPMTEHFCDSCNRLRLGADGNLRTCLSKENTPNVRDLIRAGASDVELAWALRQMVYAKVAGHEAHLRDDAVFEGWFRKANTNRNIPSLSLSTSRENWLAARLGFLHQFGPRLTGTLRSQRVLFSLRTALLNPNFAEITDGNITAEVGAAWRWDTRNESIFPTKGESLAASVGLGAIPGSDQRWWSIFASGTKLFSPHPRHVLASQASLAHADSDLPHRILDMGGPSALRSLPPTEYLVNSRVVGRLEYRATLLRDLSVPLLMLWGSELQVTSGVECGVGRTPTNTSSVCGATLGIAGVGDLLGGIPQMMGFTAGWPILATGIDIQPSPIPEVYLRWWQEF